MPERGPRPGRLALAAAGCCLATAALGQLGKAPIATGSFLLVYALSFVPYAAALRTAFRQGEAIPFPFVLLVAALLRILVFPAAASDDVNRYLWEGRVQTRGVNPYLVAPADPSLEPLRDEIWRGVNHPDLPAIYPPATQLAQRAFAMADLDPRGVKGVMALLDLSVVLALGALLRARGAPPARALVYAWSPLAVFQVAGRGHHEPLFLLPLLLAATALDRSHRLRGPGGASAALAVMVKWSGLPLILVWARRLGTPGLLAGAATTVLLTLPYAGAGVGLVGTLHRFYAEFHFGDSLNALAVAALGPAGGRALCGVALLGVMLRLALRERDAARAAGMAFGAILLLSPTVHPWYLLWVLPWQALGRAWAWVVITATVPLYAGALEAVAGGWSDLREVGWWKALAYGAGGVTWAATWWRERLRREAEGRP